MNLSTVARESVAAAQECAVLVTLLTPDSAEDGDNHSSTQLVGTPVLSAESGWMSPLDELQVLAAGGLAGIALTAIPIPNDADAARDIVQSLLQSVLTREAPTDANSEWPAQSTADWLVGPGRDLISVAVTGALVDAGEMAEGTAARVGDRL